MNSKPDFKSPRTPISDGLASDLQALGSILGSHLRGLDEHLGRQQQRLVLREERLLQDRLDLLPAAAVDLESLSKEELKTLCRQHKLTGWSKLRRESLIDLLTRSLVQPLGDSLPLDSQSGSPPPSGSFSHEGASRSERLLLLLLDHLQVPAQRIEQAWQGPPSHDGVDHALGNEN
jgi:hypothetical protein